MAYGWSRRWSSVAWMWMAAACGPQVTAPEVAGTDTGTDTGTGASPATEEGDDTSAAPDLGAGEASTGALLDCSELDNEATEGTPLILEIHNVGDAPILLDAPCFGHDWLEMTTASGSRWPGGFCGVTCEDELEFGCFDCDGCATSAYTIVGPGEHTEVTWPGVMFEPVTPPLACWQVQPCGETCSRLRLPTETISLEVAAITHADCVAQEPDPTVCDCVDEGRCYGSAKVTPSLFATASFEPGIAGPVVIELEG